MSLCILYFINFLSNREKKRSLQLLTSNQLEKESINEKELNLEQYSQDFKFHHENIQIFIEKIEVEKKNLDLCLEKKKHMLN